MIAIRSPYVHVHVQPYKQQNMTLRTLYLHLISLRLQNMYLRMYQMNILNRRERHHSPKQNTCILNFIIMQICKVLCSQSQQVKWLWFIRKSLTSLIFTIHFYTGLSLVHKIVHFDTQFSILTQNFVFMVNDIQFLLTTDPQILFRKS